MDNLPLRINFPLPKSKISVKSRFLSGKSVDNSVDNVDNFGCSHIFGPCLSFMHFIPPVERHGNGFPCIRRRICSINRANSVTIHPQRMWINMWKTCRLSKKTLVRILRRTTGDWKNMYHFPSFPSHSSSSPPRTNIASSFRHLHCALTFFFGRVREALPLPKGNPFRLFMMTRYI